MKRFAKREGLYPLFLLILILFILNMANWAIYAGEKDAEDDNSLKWLSYQQALVKSKVENIPTLIYFYSSNCGWCKKLENETFSNQQIQELMNQYFSIAKVNSDSSELVVENEKKITEQELSDKVYQVRGNPTIWFLGKNNERIASLPGFIEAELLNHILHYIKDDQYKEYTFQEYMDKQNERS